MPKLLLDTNCLFLFNVISIALNFIKNNLYLIFLSLQASLHTYIKDTYGGKAPAEDLPTIPEEIQVKHAARAWRFIWSRYTGNSDS